MSSLAQGSEPKVVLAPTRQSTRARVPRKFGSDSEDHGPPGRGFAGRGGDGGDEGSSEEEEGDERDERVRALAPPAALSLHSLTMGWKPARSLLTS